MKKIAVTPDEFGALAEEYIDVLRTNGGYIATWEPTEDSTMMSNWWNAITEKLHEVLAAETELPADVRRSPECVALVAMLSGVSNEVVVPLMQKRVDAGGLVDSMTTELDVLNAAFRSAHRS